MAVIKINPVQGQLRERAVPQLNNLAIPIKYAQKVGEGVGALGKVVSDIYKEQKTLQDQTELNDIVKEVQVDISQKSASASKNSNLDFAVKAFDEATDPSRYESYLKGKNNQVKKAFKEWLNKTRRSEYGSIASTVTKNHIAKGKLSFEDRLDTLTIQMNSSDLVKAARAKKDFESITNNISNRALYTDAEYTKLIKDKQLQAKRYALTFGATNHPKLTIENFDTIKKDLGKENESLANKVLETAKTKLLSDNQLNYDKDKIVADADRNNKIGTFTTILKSLQNDKTPEKIGNLPTLDLISDLYKEGKLNTAQYDALLNFYQDPSKNSDEHILNMINAQLYVAETIEDLDDLQNKINLSPEYLLKIGIKDVEKMNAVIEKAKDRQAFQDYKYYQNKISETLGKIENNVFKSFGPKDKSDQSKRSNALSLYNEYIQNNNSPADAFQKVVKGYMSNNKVLPSIWEINRVSSIALTQPTKVSKDAGGSKEIFNDWRKGVMQKYKDGNITIDVLKRDLESLNAMQDLFEIRTTVFSTEQAWADNNNANTSSYAGGK